MVFKLLNKFKGDVTNRFNGNTDLLEAVCAGATLVAYADGNATDAELATATRALKDNKAIAAAFTDGDIERTMNKMLDKASTRMGRVGLYDEINDVAKNPEAAEAVIVTMLDVADDDGIQDSEMKVIRDIASRLRIDVNKYL